MKELRLTLRTWRCLWGAVMLFVIGWQVSGFGEPFLGWSTVYIAAALVVFTYLSVEEEKLKTQGKSGQHERSVE